ncbi:MAG: NADH-quinone oxidoreductase subunit NuoH [Verrucomicrobiales bacterium]|nr:NADH-quinone oxidoreductase subunit NuoH [Verrucomicrobiales bacterium]
MGFLSGFLPEASLPFISSFLSIAPILGIFPLLFALTTIFERKGLGRIQNRRGPNRVGIPMTDIRIAGFGQFIADGIKSLTKEDIVPSSADKLIHFLAPVALIIPVLLMFSVLPFGKNLVPLDMKNGLLFFFAVGAASELSIFMAGWSSRNKYSLLGAMRAIAQMISYEMPFILSSLVVVMAAGSLSLVDIAEAQTGGIWNWHVFTPWGLLGMILFFIAAMAEANRSPFDLPEGESELVAGYFTEYSGFKFAIFFMAEYLGLFAALSVWITLFFGGWNGPFGQYSLLPSYLWFMLKLVLCIFFIIWIRGTMPRIRMDQLMNFAWKFMLPMCLINLLGAGSGYYIRQTFPQSPLAGWFFEWLVVGTALFWIWLELGDRIAGKALTQKREYRYADQ